MGWLSNIFSRRGRQDAARPPKARVAEHHLRRRFIENLEERVLLSVSYGNLTFSSSDGTPDSSFNNLFQHQNSVTTVTYTGSISGPSGESVSGTFTLTDGGDASTFSVGASNLSLSLPNNIVTVSGASASLTLNGSGLSGSSSNLHLSVNSTSQTTDVNNQTTTNHVALSTGAGTGYSFTWNTSTSPGTDHNIRLGVSNAKFTPLPGQDMTGSFTFEKSGSDVSITASGVAITLAGGLVNLNNASGTLDMATDHVKGSGTASVSSTIASSGASFTGVFGFAIDTTANDFNLKITGNNIAVSAGVNFTADLQFEQQSTTLVGAALKVDSFKFSDGTTDFVTASSTGANSGFGAFVFKSDQFGGVADVSATVTGDGGGVSGSGSGELIINTGTTPLSFPDPSDNSVTVNIPGNPIVAVRLSGLNLTLPGITLTNGSFDFSATGSGGSTVINVGAGGISANFGIASVSNAGGSFTFTGSNVSGSIAGTAVLNTTGASIAAVGGGTFSITFGPSSASVSASNLVVAIAGASLTGNFTLAYTPTSTTFTATNAGILFGNGLLSVTALSGSVTVITPSGGSTGVSGTVSGNVSTKIGSMQFAGPITADFSATALSLATPPAMTDSLTIGDQSVSGSFTFTKSGSNVSIAATGVNASLGGGLVTLGSASGSVTITGTQAFTGSFTGTVSAGTAAGVLFSGPLTVTVAPASITASGTGDTLTVASQSFTANLSFVEDGQGLELGISGLSFNLGNGALTVNNAMGNLLVSSMGLSGSVSGVLASNVGFGGMLGVLFSAGTTGPPVPTSATISITGGMFSVGDQFISGDFSVTVSGPTLTLSSNNLNASLGNGLVLVGPPAGSTTGSSGMLTIAGGSVTGSFNGFVSVGTAAGVSFSGPLMVSVAPGSITAGTPATPPGQTDTLTIAGQSFTAGLTFSETGNTLSVGISNLNFSLGSILTLANAHGSVTLGNTGFSGSVGGTLSSSLPGFNAASNNLSLTFAPVSTSQFITELTAGTISPQLISVMLLAAGITLHQSATVVTNNSASGTSWTITDGAKVYTLKTDPAGVLSLVGAGNALTELTNAAPGLLELTGTANQLTFANQSISGDFTFVKYGSAIHLAAANFGASLGGGLVAINNGNGSLNVDGTTGAITGSFAGNLTLGSAAAVSFSGPIAVSVTGTVVEASGTGDSITVASQTISGLSFHFFKDANGLELTVSGINLAYAGVLAVNNAGGTLLVSSTGVSGSAAGTLSSTILGLSGNLSVTFGPGSLQISGTADKLAIGDQSLTGDFSFTNDAQGLHLSSTDMNASLGNGLVTVGGPPGTNGATANLMVSGGHVTGSFSGFVSVGSGTGFSFSGPITVTVTATSITASGTGDILTVAGQQLTGSFNFSDDSTSHTLSVGITVPTFSLGGVFTLTNLTGTLTIAPTGISGTASTSVAVTSTIGGLTGTFSLSFAPGVVQVGATGAMLTVGGQSISGDFTFVQDSTGLHLTSTNFSASLGGGLVSITGGSGSLTVAAGQVTGSFTGTLAVGSATGVSFSGPITVTLTPTSISAATPAGQVDTLTIAKQQLTASLSFFKDANGLELTVSNVSFSVGGAISVTGAGGMLTVGPSGVSGSATSGSVSAVFSGFTFSGSLSVAFAPGSLQLSGTNDKLTAGDEVISGDFTFTSDNTGIHLTSSNLGASLGGGLVKVSNGSANLSLANGLLSGSFTGTLSVGSSVTGVSFSGPVAVTLALGSFSIATPQGQSDTLIVAGQNLSAGFSFTEDQSGLELAVTNLNFSLGGGALSITNAGGMLHVTSTGVTGSATGTIASNFPGFSLSGTLSIVFAPGSIQVTGTGDTLTAGDQTISGNFTFSQDNSGLHLTATNLTASLGGGLVTIGPPNGSQTGATATFNIDASGHISGSFTGTVTAGTAAAVSFAGLITVTFGP
ncbi:MAG: hypothetical protein JWL69_706, partial [Phycisphaerales bacterium]|nr:hypothetical protein [Phycisphaerales bacterium]